MTDIVGDPSYAFVPGNILYESTESNSTVQPQPVNIDGFVVGFTILLVLIILFKREQI